MLKSQSLATRILVPLVLTAATSAVLVAWMSWVLGQRWAMSELAKRQASIEIALRDSTFPLKPPVLKSLAQLTGADWITLDDSSRPLASTLQTALNPTLSAELSKSYRQTNREDGAQRPVVIEIDGRSFFAYTFERSAGDLGSDSSRRVIALFDKREVDEVARRAAVLPLATGLTTILVIGAVMFFLASRLIVRLRRLKTQVDRIADGEFQAQPLEQGNDELTRLAAAINEMARQLSELWNRVNQQQSAKLLHQISGGMAHQLRNTLTGARMALELHLASFPDAPPEEVKVSLRQLEIADGYISRLLTLGVERTKGERPQPIGECIDDVASTHEPIARHRNVALRWNVEPSARERGVRDGPSFSAALSNLLLNAIDVATEVSVNVNVESPQKCRIIVSDNGQGVASSVSDRLFEPFVTTKPEGLGLGLPLVKRTVEDLGGEITWRHHNGLTTFELTVETIRIHAS